MQLHFTGTDPSDSGQSWRPSSGLLVRFCEIFVNGDPLENADINSRYVDAIDPRLKPNQNLCQPHCRNLDNLGDLLPVQTPYFRHRSKRSKNFGKSSCCDISEEEIPFFTTIKIRGGSMISRKSLLKQLSSF